MSLKGAATSVFVIGLASVLGYASGMIKQAMIAAFFGATSDTDAYVVAHTIPDMLEWVLAGAAIRGAFLPIFTSEIEHKGRQGAWRTASSVTNLVLVFMAVLSVLGIIFSPYLTRLVAPGLDEATRHKASTLLVIMFPIMISAAGIGIAKGMLNSFRHFATPALTPLVANVMGIAAIYAFAQRLGTMSLAIGVVAGSFGGLLLLIPVLRRKGWRHYFAIDLKDPSVGKFLRLAAPLIPTALTTTLILTTDKIMASYLEQEGSIAMLNFAVRIGDIPLSLFAVAIATVIFPVLASSASKGDMDKLKNVFSTGVRMTLFVTIPMTVALIVLNRQVIGFLLERGKFTGTAATTTGLTLAFYGIGLAVRGMRGVVVNTFLSLRDSKTPLKFASLNVVYNAVLNYVLMQFMGVKGIALSTSIVNTIFLASLVNALRRKIGHLGGRKMISNSAKMLIAAVFMAAVMFVLRPLLRIETVSPTGHLLDLLIRGGIGFSVYIGMALWLKMEELELVKRAIRERFQRGGPAEVEPPETF